MTDPTCPIADSDTDVRYLAGTLSSQEAEAFEEHYFECDLCWAAVHRGAEIRSTLADESVKRLQPKKSLQSSRTRTQLWPVLAAAAVMVVAAGLWRAQRPGQSEYTRVNASETGTSVEPMRGSPAEASIAAASTDKSLSAAWPRNADARSYRVRLMSEDGRLLFNREIPDTSISVPMDSIDRVDQSGAIYWKVEGLNELRSVVSSYSLKEARASH